MTGNLVKFARAAPFVGFRARSSTYRPVEEEESKRARVLGVFNTRVRVFASRMTNRLTLVFLHYLQHLHYAKYAIHS